VGPARQAQALEKVIKISISKQIQDRLGPGCPDRAPTGRSAVARIYPCLKAPTCSLDFIPPSQRVFARYRGREDQFLHCHNHAYLSGSPA